MKRSYRQGLFVAYIAGMLWLLFGQRMAWGHDTGLQLRPFYTLQLFWNMLQKETDWTLRLLAWANLLGNVVLFIPLGCFLPWLWEKWRVFWRHTLVMAGIILAVEAIQLATGLGWCDVDDLILNLPGTMLGFLLWKWISKTRWA